MHSLPRVMWFKIDKGLEIVLNNEHFLGLYLNQNDTCNTINALTEKLGHVRIPVLTRSPICSSDILIEFPFSRETLAADGKQLHVQQRTSLLVPFIVAWSYRLHCLKSLR